MNRRNHHLAIYMVVLSTALIFVAGDAIAFCDNCDPDSDLPISVIADQYTITLESIEELPEGENGTQYQWNYTIEGPDEGEIDDLYFYAMLIPDCCSDPAIAFDLDQSLPTNLRVYPVGQGEGYLKFGRYNQQAYVIKGSPENSIYWQLVTNTDTVTTTTGLVKYRKKVGYRYKFRATSVEVPGPGCAVLLEPVRVEPRRQCFEFIAEGENEGCTQPENSVWLAEWSGEDACAVDVWAAYGDEWTCDNVKTEANKVEGDSLSTITDENGNSLSDYRINNSTCDEGWLRFTNEGGCNARCYVSGGRRYCR